MSNPESAIPLSERELQVLHMVATGASNQQIARQLVISVNTVKVHLRNIFEKLGVQSRTEATLRAIQEGWIVVSEDNLVADTVGTKTYLLPDGRKALTQSQQLYLVAAILLTIITTSIPFLNGTTLAQHIPIRVKEDERKPLYEQQPTPDPTNLAEDVSNHWNRLAPMPTHRAGLGVVAFDEQIFAIGGVKSNDKATRMVEIYDPANRNWSEGTTKPTAVTNIEARALNGKIYVPGGCTNEGQATDKLEIYDPKIDEWTKGASLPSARCGYGLAVVKDKLYLFGGWDGQTYVDTIFVYATQSQQWEVLDTNLPEAMGYIGAAVLNDRIYLAGGYDGNKVLNQTYLFVPTTKTWQKKSPMQERRAGLGLITVGEQLYAIGGGWEEPVTTSEKYDPVSDKWTTFEAPFDNQWRNLGLAALNTEIYAIGGWNGTEEKYMDSVTSYQVLYQMFLPISIRGE